MPLSEMRGRSHNANGARPRRTHAVRLVEEYGGAERVRTADLRVANATLSQLSYGPMKSMSSCALGRFVVARLRGSALGDGFGIGSARIRTADLRIDPFERQWAPNAVVHRSRTRPRYPSGTNLACQPSPSRASWASGSACSNCRIPIRSKFSLTRGVSRPSHRRLDTTRVKSCCRNRQKPRAAPRPSSASPRSISRPSRGSHSPAARPRPRRPALRT